MLQPARVVRFVAAHLLAALALALGLGVAWLLRDALVYRGSQNWELIRLLSVGIPAGVVLLLAAVGSAARAFGERNREWPWWWVALVIACDLVAVMLPATVGIVYGHA